MLELLPAGCQLEDEMQKIEHIEHRHQTLEQCDVSNQKSAKTLHIAIGRPGISAAPTAGKRQVGKDADIPIPLDL
jgi:hypothetical protein